MLTLAQRRGARLLAKPGLLGKCLRARLVLTVSGDCTQVTKAVFVEPCTARVTPLGEGTYTDIEAVWNHHNYWVPVPAALQAAHFSAPQAFQLDSPVGWACLLQGPAHQARSLCPCLHISPMFALLGHHLDSPSGMAGLLGGPAHQARLVPLPALRALGPRRR